MIALFKQLGATLLIGCAATPVVGQPLPQLSGTVVRADNGLPIAEASVKLMGDIGCHGLSPLVLPDEDACSPATFTDRDGHYAFNHLHADSYLIEVSAGGFLNNSSGPYPVGRSVTLTVDSMSHVRLAFRMLRAASGGRAVPTTVVSRSTAVAETVAVYAVSPVSDTSAWVAASAGDGTSPDPRLWLVSSNGSTQHWTRVDLPQPMQSQSPRIFGIKSDGSVMLAAATKRGDLVIARCTIRRGCALDAPVKASGTRVDGRIAAVESFTGTSATDLWALLAGEGGAMRVPTAIGHSRDSGRTWRFDPAGSGGIELGTDFPRKLIAAGPDRAWIIVLSSLPSVELSRTVDGGRTCHDVKTPPIPGNPSCCHDLDFAGKVPTFSRGSRDCLDVDVAPTLADSAAPYPYVRYCSADSGVTWVAKPMSRPAGVTSYFGAGYINDSLGWANAGMAGDRNVVLETKDGGRTWAPAPAPLTGAMTGANASAQSISVAATNGKAVWILREARDDVRTLLYSRDTGLHWQLLVPPPQ